MSFEELELRKEILRYQILLIDKELEFCEQHKIGLSADELVKILGE